MKIAEVQNLKRIFTVGKREVPVLNGINLSVEAGEFVAIVGASGSGKTTLLHLMGALDTPTVGKIKIRGCEISHLSQDEQIIFRRRNIGFVFQNYNLIPVLNVYENIVLPLRLDGRKVDDELLEMLLISLKLKDKKYQMPNTLSGGQQQRVAIARALITKPALVLADEPTGNLDARTSMEVIGLMKTLAYQFHQTLVVVTHDEEIAQMADRIVRMEDGKIVEGDDDNGIS